MPQRLAHGSTCDNVVSTSISRRLSRRPPTGVKPVLIGLALGLLGVPATAHAGIHASDRITKNGLGPVEIGMTIDEASEALGFAVDEEMVLGGCGTATVSRRHKVWVLTTNGTITRIYIDGRQLRTRKGIHNGSTVTQLRRRYGRLLVRRSNEYTRLPQYHLRQGNRWIVFDTSRRGRVAEISVGRLPEVRYIEGCS